MTETSRWHAHSFVYWKRGNQFTQIEVLFGFGDVKYLQTLMFSSVTEREKAMDAFEKAFNVQVIG